MSLELTELEKAQVLIRRKLVELKAAVESAEEAFSKAKAVNQSFSNSLGALRSHPDGALMITGWPYVDAFLRENGINLTDQTPVSWAQPSEPAPWTPPVAPNAPWAPQPQGDAK